MSNSEIATQEKAVQQGQAQRQRFVKPRYEVETSKDAYLVRVYAPGASKESVNITLEKDTLSISAHRVNHFREGWKAISREIVDADYRLQLQLNAAIDENKIQAKLENGVLNVTLPVAEEAKPRQIAIK